MMPRKPKGSSGKRLVIRCAACREPVLLYQKDGPGSVQRLYLDRILAPDAHATLRDTCGAREDMPNLLCPACSALIGTPMRHSSGRLAFRALKGQFIRQRVSDDTWPPA